MPMDDRRQQTITCLDIGCGFCFYPDGISVLTGTKDETEHRDKGGETKKAREITTIVNLAYNANISGEEFRLSFSGLTEPTGVVWDKPYSRWWLWFIVVGVSFLAIGV